MNDFKTMIAEGYGYLLKDSNTFMASKYQFSEQERDDIYQELWAWIFQQEGKCPDLRKEENRPWFFQKLKWRCLNFIRGTKRYYLRNENYANQQSWTDEGLKEPTDSEEELAFAYEMMNQVKKGFGDKCRRLFKLFYGEAYSVKDISEQLEMAEQSIKNNLANCRKELKKILEDLWNRN